MAFLRRMRQSNKCGSVRNVEIINLYLGSGGGPWVSSPCVLQDTSHIYWFHMPKTINHEKTKNSGMRSNFQLWSNFIFSFLFVWTFFSFNFFNVSFLKTVINLANFHFWLFFFYIFIYPALEFSVFWTVFFCYSTGFYKLFFCCFFNSLHNVNRLFIGVQIFKKS